MRTDLIILALLIVLLICVYKNDFINISGLTRINEPFFDEKSDLINSISEKLTISTRRIIDLEHGFVPEGSKNLVVKFAILPKNSLELNEPTVEELQGTINHLFETNTFIINYRDELISLDSNSSVSFNSNSSGNSSGNANGNTEPFNNLGNNVKPKEEFSNYHCNVNPNFDNTSLLKAKNIVDSTYRNFPLNEALTRFIEVENIGGKMKYFNTPRSCNN
jgi:hypothetical protein